MKAACPGPKHTILLKSHALPRAVSAAATGACRDKRQDNVRGARRMKQGTAVAKDNSICRSSCRCSSLFGFLAHDTAPLGRTLLGPPYPNLRSEKPDMIESSY